MSNFAFKRGSVFLEHKSAFSRTSSGVKRDISLEPRAHLSRLNTPSECQSRYQSAPFRLVYADFSNSLHLNLIAFPDKSLYVEIKSFGTRLKHCGSIYCIIASVFGFINRMPIVVANIDNFCTIALRKVFLLFKSNFCVPYIEILFLRHSCKCEAKRDDSIKSLGSQYFTQNWTTSRTKSYLLFLWRRIKIVTLKLARLQRATLSVNLMEFLENTSTGNKDCKKLLDGFIEKGCLDLLLFNFLNVTL